MKGLEPTDITKIKHEDSQLALNEERKQLFEYDQEKRVQILVEALKGKVEESEIRRYLTEINDEGILQLVKERNKIFAEILFCISSIEDNNKDVSDKIRDLRNARSGTYVHPSKEFTEYDIRNAIATFRSTFLLVRYLENKDAKTMGRKMFIHQVMFRIVNFKMQLPLEYHFFFDQEELKKIHTVFSRVDTMLSMDANSVIRQSIQEKREESGSHPKIAERGVEVYLDKLKEGMARFKEEGKKELDVLVKRFPDLNVLADKILEISN